MRTTLFLFTLGFILNIHGFANTQYEILKKGHVHEAFMNNESSVTLMTAIPFTPPPPLQESIPRQTDTEMVWVEGYWEWSFERSEFIWCSGCWRRPPPGHRWIAGSWKKTDEGWVRLKGFWSQAPESRIAYIRQTPPDPYNENPKNRPGKEYFWMSGYWKYEDQRYAWYSGKWERLDQNWIYVPAKYVWRPQGYVFVPAFWDLPLDERGVAYACVALPIESTEIDYLPEMIIEPMALVEECLFYYPDYYYFYFYFCHFHPDWWMGCPWCPPWWSWDWWWMPWWDHWGIWWWWCHPGFPAPGWLDPWLLNVIFSPPIPLTHEMESVHPPVIIGPKGAIPPARLIDSARGKPILPEDLIDSIQGKASQGLKKGSTKEPMGPHKPLEDLSKDAPPMPQTTPKPPARAPVGKAPSLPPSGAKKPPQVETPSKPERRSPSRQPSKPLEQPPSYRPHGQGQGYYPQQRPDYTPPQRPDYRPQRPDYTPQTPQRPDYRPQRPDYTPQPPQKPDYRPQKPRQKPEFTPQYTPQYTPQTPQISPRTPSTKYTPRLRSPQQQYDQMRRVQPSQTPNQQLY